MGNRGYFNPISGVATLLTTGDGAHLEGVIASGGVGSLDVRFFRQIRCKNSTGNQDVPQGIYVTLKWWV